jgi:hypothetical protein
MSSSPTARKPSLSASLAWAVSGDHGQARARRLGLPDGARRLHPVHHRHRDVHEHEVVGPPPGAIDALPPVMGLVHLVAVLFQKVAQHDAVDAVVLHDQDLLSGARAPGAGWILSAPQCGDPAEFCPPPAGAGAPGTGCRAPGAFESDLAPHRIDERRTMASPRPVPPDGARIGRVERHEILEDAVLIGGIDADPVVDHAELHEIAIVETFGLDRDRPVAGELDRVADQVQQHLPQAGRIAARRSRDHGCAPLHQRVAAVLGDAALAFDQFAHQRRKREDFAAGDDLARLGARDLEHVVDVMQKLPSRGTDDVEIFQILRAGPPRCPEARACPASRSGACASRGSSPRSGRPWPVRPPPPRPAP